MTLILNQGQADCRDAGEYICTMIYVAKGGSKSETTSTSDMIDIAPTEFNVTRVPAKVPIKVGMKLQLSCTAVIGTRHFRLHKISAGVGVPKQAKCHPESVQSTRR